VKRTLALFALLAVCGSGALHAGAQNGAILDQQLDAHNRGYTVMRVWGTHYEMGYAHAQLLGDHVVQGVEDTKGLMQPFVYQTLRGYISQCVWLPAESEDELDGMVASLAITHPTANIDKTDLKVANTYGDWGYACRSHTCWGRYVADPVQTLSTRRLDFGTPIPAVLHHVLCAWDPTDGGVRWVNLSWPGHVSVVTGVNEYGTLASLHDYSSHNADLASNRLPRCMACRYALTAPRLGNTPAHLADVFAALQPYEVMTGSFINYYVPMGHGGVMVCDPHRTGSDFYYCRTPHAAWHHGEAMITTNSWTDGSYTPPDENFGADAYYNDETPKTLASHWNLLATGSNGLHLMSVAYEAPGRMRIWADGRLVGSRTPRLEWAWDALFGPRADFDRDGAVDAADFGLLTGCLAGPERGVSGACRAAVLDYDGDVDLADFALLQAAARAG
jgi:hypothetical protein